MDDVAGWVAPAATMLAAMITAANLGARTTGWGFVVFAVGSVAWLVVALGSGQQNLLWTNGVLTLVNAVGIWRWLGRQARYEEGGQAAAERSASSQVPTLSSIAALPGTRVVDRQGRPAGVIVDAMMRMADARLAYVVVREGGVVGIGERLHALSPDDIAFTEDGPVSRVTSEALAARAPLASGAWPASVQASPQP